jgi:hypothetical protein
MGLSWSQMAKQYSDKIPDIEEVLALKLSDDAHD